MIRATRAQARQWAKGLEKLGYWSIEIVEGHPSGIIRVRCMNPCNMPRNIYTAEEYQDEIR